MYQNYVIVFVLGILLGILIFFIFLKPESETVYKETVKVEIDTVYVQQQEIVERERTQIKHVYLRDTVLIEPIRPQIKQFSATFPLLYGNANFDGEVLGEVLKTSLRTDFRIPTVTNTITRENTKTTTIIQKGIFVGGGFSNTTDWHVGASYLGKGYLVELNYTPTPTFAENPYIQASIKINPFSKK